MMVGSIRRRLVGVGIAVATLSLIGEGILQAQITARQDAVGKLLNPWHAAGSAAGLGEITYENRDGGHSALSLLEWPQLQVRTAVSGDIGPANKVRPMPLIGNCSMASPADKGGSLPRIYMAQPQGFNFLAGQYADNNLFIYPEHQDHDPGWNGRGGWGDLFPANVPMLSICQGSSYKDQVFLRAFLSATAALSPETQKLILRKQALAPTLQMLLRRSYKPCETPEDYFTGKAHPVVFDGDLIDEEKMARLAHEMTPASIPPVVRLAVAGESSLKAGRDFFEIDAVRDATLGNTPFAIARIFRASAFVHEILVSAERSTDARDQPLKYRWVPLQGDLKRLRIETANEGARAKISVAWHPEQHSASGLQTHRVDIGVFAHNGSAWSAPAIISFYMLPNEERFYDEKGRTLEISYDAANPDPGLPPLDDLRWLSLGRRMGSDQKHPAIALLTHHLSEIAVVRLQSIAARLAEEQDAWRKLSGDARRKDEAGKVMATLQGKLRKELEQPLDGGAEATIARAFEKGIRSVAAITDLYLAGQDVMLGLIKDSGRADAMSAFAQARQRLVDYGLYQQDDTATFSLTKRAEALTTAERHYLAQFHLTVLHLALLPEFLDRVEAPAYVDSRLTTPKAWRDVYRYGEDGKVSGWTRHAEGMKHEFDAEGRLLPGGLGSSPVPVKYLRDEKSGRLIFTAQ